jgi:hypothetical protein
VTAVDQLSLRDPHFCRTRLVGHDEAQVDHLASLIDQVLIAGVPEIADQDRAGVGTGLLVDECRGMVSPQPFQSVSLALRAARQ